MTDPHSSNHHPLDEDFENRLAEMFRRTSPPVPPFVPREGDVVLTPVTPVRSLPMSVRIGIPLTAIALSIVAALLLRPDEAGANFTFQDVQQQVEQTKSLTYRQRTIRQIEGVDEPEVETDRVSILAPGTIRIDMENGNHSIFDVRGEKTILVEHEQKTVTKYLGIGHHSPQMKQMNFYNHFRDLAKGPVEKLPAKSIDGTSCPGFLVEQKIEHPISKAPITYQLQVWVDPQSKLPVRIEMGDANSDSTPKIETRTIMDQIRFDVPLEESLFSFDAPEGYEVETFGVEKLAPPVEAARQNPVLTPNVGLGDVKFGMSKQEVIDRFGEPDRILPVGESGSQMLYLSRGYSVFVSEIIGVSNVQAATGQTSIEKQRAFAGKTEKGIGMGASEKDITSAYGEPSRIDDDQAQGGLKTLYYDDLNGWFSLAQDKLVSMYFNIPRESKLKKFEENKSDDE